MRTVPASMPSRGAMLLESVRHDFVAPDGSGAVTAARAAGHEIVQQGSMGGADGMEFAYVEATAGASYVELAWIGRDIRAFYDTLRSS